MTSEDAKAEGRPHNGVRTVKLKELLGPRREVVIDHDGDRYSLRLTSKGKLLLTK